MAIGDFRSASTAGGQTVMVLRGWVARELRDRTRPMPFVTPDGPIRIEGVALSGLPQPMVLGGADSSAEPGSSVIQRFDLDSWRAAQSL